MKFSFPEDQSRSDGDVIAYLENTASGGLVMRDTTGFGGVVMLSGAFVYTKAVWEPKPSDKKFYKGDSVTITF